MDRNEGLLLLAGQANFYLTQRIGKLGLAVGPAVVCTRILRRRTGPER